MLIENTMPNNRQIGTLYLMPGINQVDKDAWEGQMKRGYRRPVKGLVEEGILNIIDDSRVSVSLVKKTYDVKVLEEWLVDAKGPLKGAIKKQIATMTDDEKEAV